MPLHRRSYNSDQDRRGQGVDSLLDFILGPMGLQRASRPGHPDPGISTGPSRRPRPAPQTRVLASGNSHDLPTFPRKTLER